ncbi:SEFIR domain-containing protein [Proteus sp. WDL240414]|uniref:SEFIR domain-containing protein n=1 Tax=Proteus TaxID=583 RepID=UPI001B980516|nr:SEFIR domain-containing protein [Proteus columbae]MDU1885996.1 TIR domain-containing protein [Proteus mirabilis]HBC8683492.1 TIR domain-containing protein [Proteus mirabilis]HEJ9412746.1 TIR domain-containing protein [Proteus mirabilis]HEJ9416673.1 TIR domain-containing protein [Proteus mirabilis]HEK0623028.1 TIR domain-containing protein [Proteus mirabilis]
MEKLTHEVPKVFISYSWSSHQHQTMVKDWADRLLADGIDVKIDIYDLKEGDDKYAFMESMVTDETVSHVLLICDSKYKEKADARNKGVGTETQIISGEIYRKVQQSKFIPIFCEFDKSGEPILPTFASARIGIDFSSPEKTNKNWEQLLRLLYNKPKFTKPTRGRTPSFLDEEEEMPSSGLKAKYELLKQAIVHNDKKIKLFRNDFILSCIEFADALRIRETPNTDSFPEQILNIINKLKIVRNFLSDWLLLESEINHSQEFTDSVIKLLEQLRELKSRPPELTRWNENWFEGHSVFVYEQFLYIIASLIKTERYDLLHEVYTSHYLNPEIERVRGYDYDNFSSFYGSSTYVGSALSKNTNFISNAAEIIKRQADRNDLTFNHIVEAETITYMMAIINLYFWYPGTLNYPNYTYRSPFFIRAAQHKNFQKLIKITGIQTVDEFRNIIETNSKHDIFRSRRSHSFGRELVIKEVLNLDNLDSIK